MTTMLPWRQANQQSYQPPLQTDLIIIHWTQNYGPMTTMLQYMQAGKPAKLSATFTDRFNYHPLDTELWYYGHHSAMDAGRQTQPCTRKVPTVQPLTATIPFVSLSLSKTRRKASGAKASPAFTSSERFMRMVPESALRAWERKRGLGSIVCVWSNTKQGR